MPACRAVLAAVPAAAFRCLPTSRSQTVFLCPVVSVMLSNGRAVCKTVCVPVGSFHGAVKAAALRCLPGPLPADHRLHPGGGP